MLGAKRRILELSKQNAAKQMIRAELVVSSRSLRGGKKEFVGAVHSLGSRMMPRCPLVVLSSNCRLWEQSGLRSGSGLSTQKSSITC
jgi:hypothetical protein